MLGCRHPGLFFRVHPVGRKKNFFYHFEMEKVALIFIYNIFVTKKIFFRNEHQKKFIDPHVSCRPGKVMANQQIFKSGRNLDFYFHTSLL